MSDKKPHIKLFKIKHTFCLVIAAIIGWSFAVYRLYEPKGHMDTGDIVIALVAGITGISIVFGVIKYGNR